MYSDQFPYLPHMVCNPGRRRRGHPERPVDPHEVVPREVEAQRGPEVLPPLAEGVRQPGKPSNLHPHREVLPLNV